MKIGIVGITGAVGKELLALIKERKFSFSEIRHFASNKSVGKKIKFKSKIYKIIKLDKKRAIEKRKKIESQLNKLKTLKIDELRLEQEIFYFLDKIDINEEITRLTKHISLFKKTLKERGPHGKKINFISQELGREINTIGAKCNDFDIQSNTIKMKTNLEKIKEESFNIL
mgnify:CR=1 FL=1